MSRVATEKAQLCGLFNLKVGAGRVPWPNTPDHVQSAKLNKTFLTGGHKGGGINCFSECKIAGCPT